MPKANKEDKALALMLKKDKNILRIETHETDDFFIPMPEVKDPLKVIEEELIYRLPKEICPDFSWKDVKIRKPGGRGENKNR